MDKIVILRIVNMILGAAAMILLYMAFWLSLGIKAVQVLS